MSELLQILAYLIGNLTRITKNTISKVYDPYFLSYSEKTDGTPPVTNLAIPPLDGFTLVGAEFCRLGMLDGVHLNISANFQVLELSRMEDRRGGHMAPPGP